jgi:hypothetical protein
MDQSAFFPFVEDADRLERYCKLPLHSGVGSIAVHGDPNHPIAQMARQIRKASGITDPEPTPAEFAASFLVPATGNCVVLLRWPGASPLSQNFGQELTVCGDSQDGPFRFICPAYYICSVSTSREKPGWAVANPVNQPATVTYGQMRPIARVVATLNNFDFDQGNCQNAISHPGVDEVLRVHAEGREVDFTWRQDRAPLKRLVDARLIPATALVTFSFSAWPNASEQELSKFALNVASLCSYVAGQHTGVPVLSFHDSGGKVVRRTLGSAIESKFRRNYALPWLDSQEGLPKLFAQCFAEHVRMQQSELWRKLPFLCAAIDDPPYLEQKYATLMMAVEMLIRSSLIEQGELKPEEAESKTLPKLIGMARGMLGWTVPGHYTEDDRYRKVRNAVDHGGRLPHDIAQVRHDFDKWRLFLTRRFLIRLGYVGSVESAQRGFASISPVDEFSEEHNSFRP